MAGVYGEFYIEMARTAQRMHDAYDTCICGASKAALVEFFGIGIMLPDTGKHIATCEQCGGDVHVTEDRAECMVCGRSTFATDDAQLMGVDQREQPKRGYLPMRWLPVGLDAPTWRIEEAARERQRHTV